MAYIKKLKNNELIGGTDNTDVYPVTSTKAVYDPDNVSQEDINNDRLERIQTLEGTAEVFNEFNETADNITYWGELDGESSDEPVEIPDDDIEATDLANAEHITLDDIPDGDVYLWTNYVTRSTYNALLSAIAALEQRVEALENE